jgi:hypothetical protein
MSGCFADSMPCPHFRQAPTLPLPRLRGREGRGLTLSAPGGGEGVAGVLFFNPNSNQASPMTERYKRRVLG